MERTGGLTRSAHFLGRGSTVMRDPTAAWTNGLSPDFRMEMADVLAYIPNEDLDRNSLRQHT